MAQLQLATINMADINPIVEIDKHSFSWPWKRVSFVGVLACKQGFRVIGKRPNYYNDTREDALVLLKNLKEDL